MTVVKVIDASALGAVLFAEDAGEAVLARVQGASLSAPTLLAYELTSVCLKKIRAHPAQRTDFLASLASWNELGIRLFDPDHDHILEVAEETGLTAYDASYLWLARRLEAELVTLDRDLARTAARMRTRS